MTKNILTYPVIACRATIITVFYVKVHVQLMPCPYPNPVVKAGSKYVKSVATVKFAPEWLI